MVRTKVERRQKLIILSMTSTKMSGRWSKQLEAADQIN